MFGPSGRPLRRIGPLGNLLRRELSVGEQASVLQNFPHKGGTEVDANLFQKFPDGSVRRIDHRRLNPGTLSDR